MRLDGNVLAGPLATVYGSGATEIVGRCRGCGDVAALAQSVVFVGAGMVVRCRGCSGVLLTVVVVDRSPVVTITLAELPAPAG